MKLSSLATASLAARQDLLVITPTRLELRPGSCLGDGYLGAYGPTMHSVGRPEYHAYRNTEDCFMNAVQENEIEAARLVYLKEGQVAVHVQYAGVDEAMMKGEPSFGEAIEQFQTRVKSFSPASFSDESQDVLRMPVDTKAQLVTMTGHSALLTVPETILPVIDTLLPRYMVPVVLPNAQSVAPVPDEAVKRVKGWLDSLSFSADVAAIVDHLSVDSMRSDIRYLTGEDESSGIVSRQSFSQGARQAAEWIKGKIESTGATCELKDFLPGFAPNVVCRYPSVVNTTGTIILSAHYDSRGSFGSLRAPGGDDDGSGVLSILGIARTIKEKGIKFKSNVELVAFAGEEQGLLGSRAYSKELREANANVTLMIQSDMLGYHKADEPPQLGLPAYIGTTEVAQLLANVSHIYSPELSVGITSACCSDHQTFHEQGFPATQAFERAGYIVDPMYHNSGDLSDRPGYDIEQIRSIAKATFGTLLHAAGFEFDSST